jgi:hypothetical protein
MMKKIQVVKDKNGKVIATYEKATAGNGPSVAPVLEAGHTEQEMDVADDYHMDIDKLYAQHG